MFSYCCLNQCIYIFIIFIIYTDSQKVIPEKMEKILCFWVIGGKIHTFFNFSPDHEKYPRKHCPSKVHTFEGGAANC